MGSLLAQSSHISGKKNVLESGGCPLQKEPEPSLRRH